MTRAPLALTVTPLRTVLPQGVHTATEKITVTNSGTAPFAVHATPMDVMAVKGGCGVSPAPAHWLSISHIGVLQPGQSKVATVDLHAPAGINTDVAAVFVATAPSAGPGGHAGGGVGTQFIVTGRGTSTAPVCSHHAKAVPPAGGGLSGVALAGAVGLALLAVVAVLAVARLRRHRRT